MSNRVLHQLNARMSLRKPQARSLEILADVLERINLAPEARDALLDRTGPFGDALNFVEAYELGLWEQATALGTQLGVEPDRIPSIYTDAVQWAAEQFEPNARKAA